jgi:hypothetical protein
VDVQGAELDVIQAMKTLDFVAYDFNEPVHRPLDGTVSQIDIAFVQEKGFFRKHHHYATAARRELQNQALLNSSGCQTQNRHKLDRVSFHFIRFYIIACLSPRIISI